MALSILNAHRRHDKLLRRLLVASQERADAQRDGSSSPRVERLSVRERSLVSSVRRLRLHLGLPETFDAEFESARLGIDGRRPGRRRSRTETPAVSADRSLRPRITPTHTPKVTVRSEGNGAGTRDLIHEFITVNDLVRIAMNGAVDPDSTIVVHGPLAGRAMEVIGIRARDDRRLQIDIGRVSELDTRDVRQAGRPGDPVDGSPAKRSPAEAGAASVGGEER